MLELHYDVAVIGAGLPALLQPLQPKQGAEKVIMIERDSAWEEFCNSAYTLIWAKMF